MDAQGIRERAQTDPKALEDILTPLVKDPPDGIASLMRDLLALYREDKACLKVIKRAIFKLGQRGIRVEVEEPKRPALRPAREEELKGYLGLFDASGRLFLALERHTLRGLVGYLAIGSFAEGIGDFQRAETSKKAFRQFLQGLQRPYLPPYVEIPPGYAKEILEEWAGIGTPEDWKGIQELQGLAYDGPKPLILRDLTYDQLPEGDPQKDTEGLLQELPLFGLWALELDEAKPYYEEMRSALQSPLALTEAQKAQRLDSIWLKATERLFPTETRLALKRGLEEVALILPAGKREAALRLAKDLEAPPSPLKVHPLLKAILSLAFRIIEGEGKKEEPLIIRP